MKKFLCTLILAAALATGSSAQTGVNLKSINITNITAYAKDAKIVIDWATDGHVPSNYWEVQRSTDGVQFSAVALVLGADPRQEGDKYQYVEKVKDTKLPTVYYRVRHIGADGREQYSNIIQPVK